MAQVWRFPCTPLADAAGVAVNTVTLTGSGMAKLPRVPAALLVRGSKVILEATFEVTSTSATPTVTLDFRLGALSSAIASKIVVAQSGALAINVAATAWPGIMKYVGTFRDLSPTAGVINGGGGVKSWFGASPNGGLNVAAAEFPMPITAAARTVSTLVTSADLEVDVGVTLSSVTGTPSILVTNLWAELSG